MKHVLPFAFAAAASVGAQSPVPLPNAVDATGAVASAGLRVPVHGRDGDAAYGLWAGGNAYKASFHDGMTFVPYLGAAYPHNQPFAWRTTSVRVGEQELLAAGRAPALRHTDFHVAYEHGSVTETYDVLAEGIEQRFVLRERPAAAGDLRIHGALRTALWSPAVENVRGALVFRDAQGQAIVGYGAATAIDADGERFAMTTSYANGTVTLQLAAADLARADYPLVVDPLLSTAFGFGQYGGIVGVGDIDAAHDGSSVSMSGMVCFTTFASASDSDVHAGACAESGSIGSVVFADLANTTAADHARAAFVAGTNRWAIVYQNLIVATQQMQLRATTVPANSTTITSTSIPHLLATGVHEWRPEVGGVQLGGTGNRALVVFQQEVGTAQFANTADSTVRGMFFDTTTAAGQWTATFAIQGNAGDDTERPSLNRTAEGGSGYSWFVVCQAFTNNAGNDDWDLFGRLVNQGGAVTPLAWVSSLGTTHKLGACVDGRAGRYCVLYSTANTSIGKNLDVVGNDIRSERVDWSHGQASQSSSGNWPVVTLMSLSFRTLEATGIAFDGNSRSHWTVGWRNSTTSPAIYASRLGHRGDALQAPDLVATSGSTSPGPVTVLFGALTGTVTVIWSVFNIGFEAYRRQFDLPAPASPSSTPSTCGSPSLSWQGPSPLAATDQRIGSEFCGPRVQGAGANDLHLMLVAIATANVPVADPVLGTNCTLLVPFSGPDYLGNLTLTVGADVNWVLPLPEFLPSMTLHFQDWVLQSVNGRLWGSNRLTVPLLR